MRAPISVVIITKNEGDILARTLEPLRHFSEVLLVDSGSQDSTCDIATRFGCSVFHRDWTGFGDQKRYAVELAQHDWVLSIDADEVLSPELVSNILMLDLSDSKIAYEIRRRNFFLGREVKFSGWNPDWVLRLFNREYANFSKSKVHERVLHRGAIRRLSGCILHHSYRDELDVERKVHLYSSLAETQVNGNFWYAVLNATYTFFRTYFLRLGFLDGVAGLGIALMNTRVNYKKHMRP